MPPEKFFLMARSENGRYWPLDLKPANMTAVRRLHHWMASPYAPADDYVVAVWDIPSRSFKVHATGETLDVYNSIYTAEAWDKFLADRPKLEG